MTNTLKENPWQISQAGNQWESDLQNLASSLKIEDWDRFIFRLQAGLTRRYMIDHIKGEPSIGKQLKNADKLMSKSLKLVSTIEDIIGSPQTRDRNSGSYKLLNLLDQSNGITNEKVLQDLHTEDLLKNIKKGIDNLILRLEKIEKPIQKGRAGNRPRLGIKEFWLVIADYWYNDLDRSTYIKRSGGQRNPENKYSGDFMDFAWPLNQILGLETNSKEALGEELYSLLPKL